MAAASQHLKGSLCVFLIGADSGQITRAHGVPQKSQQAMLDTPRPILNLQPGQERWAEQFPCSKHARTHVHTRAHTRLPVLI